MEWHWGRWTNNNSGNYQSWSYINLAIMWRRWLEHFHLIFSLPLGILLVNTSLKYRVSDTLSLPAACGGWGWILAADIALEFTYLKSQYMISPLIDQISVLTLIHANPLIPINCLRALLQEHKHLFLLQLSERKKEVPCISGTFQYFKTYFCLLLVL